jgi:hypothetical protein
VATVTTGGSGNWSSTTPNAPWPGGTLPNATDDVIVATTHTLTVDGDYTIGSSPDNITTYAIDCQGTGMLTINTTRTLTVKGNIRFNGGTNVRLTISGTGRLYFDTSARTSGTKTYRILNSSTEFTYYLRGTDKDNLATIEADSGGYWYGERTAGGTRLNVLDIQFGLFKRTWDGTAGISALGVRVNRNTAGAAATVDYLVMDACGGPIIMTDSASGRTASFTRVFVRNSAAGFYGISVGAFGASNTITMRQCSIDRSQNAQSHAGTDAQECYFHGATGVFYAGSGNTRWNAMSVDQASGDGPSCVVSAAQNASGSIRDQLSIARGTGDNVHWKGPSSSTAALTLVEDGRIMCSASNSTNGDGSGISLTGAGSVLRNVNCLWAAIANGNQPGTWLSMLGNANMNVEVEHCTGIVSDGAPRGVSVGEGYAGHAGMIAKLRYNLAKDGLAAPCTSRMLFYQDTTTTAQKLNAANAGDNWADSATANTDAEAYDQGGTQDPPAIASLYDASNMIDAYRTLEDWAGWWGNRIGANGDGVNTPNADATHANAHLLLRDTYYLGLYSGTDMIQLACQYIRRGYIPTNAVGRAAGGDGLTRGMFGAWAPALSALSATSSGFSLTTNAADGTLYWVVTTSATAPDWDRIIAGQDQTGAALSAPYKGSTAVAGTSVSDSFGALANGTYYFHCVHRGAGSEASLDDYLRTSTETSSASFAVGAGGGVGGLGSIRNAIRSTIRSPLSRIAA